MSNDNQPDEALADQAKAYVDSLPDETAAGRLVTDDGAPADTDAWEKQEATQQAALKEGSGEGSS